jgi:hypothetical protein
VYRAYSTVRGKLVISGDSAVSDYEYELRRGTAVLATGHLQLDEQPSPGDVLTLGRREVHVEDVIAVGRSRRLILTQGP